MPVDVVEEAVDGMRADRIALETRDEILDQSRIVFWRAQKQLPRVISEKLVQVQVQVCPRRVRLSLLVARRRPKGESSDWKVRYCGNVVVRRGVDAHMVRKVNGGGLLGSVGRRTGYVVERGEKIAP